MIKTKFFDKYADKDVYAYTLSDEIKVTVCNLGATILSVNVPDKDGNFQDVALGMTTAEVEDFPAFIIVDDKGNDFFADFKH